MFSFFNFIEQLSQVSLKPSSLNSSISSQSTSLSSEPISSIDNQQVNITFDLNDCHSTTSFNVSSPISPRQEKLKKKSKSPCLHLKNTTTYAISSSTEKDNSPTPDEKTSSANNKVCRVLHF